MPPNPSPHTRPPRAASVHRPRPLSDDEAFAARLAAMDFRCPACDYSLRGIAGRVCPECGLELSQSRLGSRVAYWCCAPFFVGILGIIMAFLPLAGAFVVLARTAWFSGRTDIPERLNFVMLAGAGVCLGALFARWVNWSGVWRPGRAPATGCWPRGAGCSRSSRAGSGC